MRRRPLPRAIRPVPRPFVPADRRRTFSSSPELAFVQMAEVLDCPRLVKLGDELCGIYGIETVGIVDFDRTSPFTTVKRLGRFLLKAECMPGLVKARKAVRHIAPGSLRPWKRPSSCCSACPRGSAGTACRAP